ncbi:MAG: AAA family ATPase [FCB group bacterium]|nr:AAA family ATPase [FCB group bacterium]
MNSEKAKLVKFEVNNIACIRFAEVEFTENDNLVVVGGKNGSGKSSLLQALMFAFEGKKGMEKDPLRYGADKGFVKVTLGGNEFQIRRAITEKSETLTVKGPDGKNITSPQKVLNEIIGSIGIDPSIIWQMSGPQISQTLRDSMGIDLSELDTKEKKAVDARKIANAKTKKIAAIVEAAEYHEGVPDEKQSASELVSEFSDAEKYNKTIDNARNAFDGGIKRYNEIDVEINNLQERINALCAESEQLKVESEKANEFLASNEYVDLESIRIKMVNVEAINEKVEANKRHLELTKELSDSKSKATVLDKEVKAVRQDKLDLIASSQFPLDGVEFDSDGQLILDEKPWHAWSDGERLLASFEIAAAMSPGVNAVVLRQGALFDEDAKKVIADIAKEKGYIVLMEVVGESNDVQIIMDNGQVKDQRG